MRFNETHEDDSRIFVGALEAPAGDGYIAALVVNRARGVPDARHAQAFRDDSLACGYRWTSAEQALHYAFNRGARDDPFTFADAQLLSTNSRSTPGLPANGLHARLPQR